MDKMLYEINEAVTTLSVGRTKLYELMATGEIASVKVGKRRLIPAAALERFVSDLTDPPRGAA